MKPTRTRRPGEAQPSLRRRRSLLRGGHGDGRRRPQRLSLPTVITSYSIHYTKLYELQDREQKGRGLAGAGPGEAHHVAAFEGAREAAEKNLGPEGLVAAFPGLLS